MSNVIIYEDDDFVVRGEVLLDNPFIHVSVHNYNKSVRKRMLSVWCDIKQELWTNGWDFVFSHSTNAKFARLFGGNRLEAADLPGEMFIWELKQQLTQPTLHMPQPL